MNKTKFKYLALILVAVLAGCLITQKVAVKNEYTHSIFQYSTINALMQGVFDGQLTVGELRKKGDFGLGTFNALNGEMIVYNGQVFRANSQGDVLQVNDNECVPFATIGTFKADSIITFSNPIILTKIEALLDSVLPSVSLFYAIRVEATFDTLTIRSVSPQSKPYKPLVEVVKNQTVQSYKNAKGTFIGFKMPNYMGEANVKGYHLHYLSADKLKGGHVLDAVLKSGRVIISYFYHYSLQLPDNDVFLKVSKQTDSHSVNIVEKAGRTD